MLFLKKNKPFKVEAEKGPKYSKVLYKYYFHYILCVNLFV